MPNVNEPCVCPSVRQRIFSYLLITRAVLMQIGRALFVHTNFVAVLATIRPKKETIHHIDGRRARNRTQAHWNEGTKAHQKKKENQKNRRKIDWRSEARAKHIHLLQFYVTDDGLQWPINLACERGRAQEFYLCVTMDEMNGCAALERVKHHFHDYSLAHLLNGRTNRSHETNALHGHVEYGRRLGTGHNVLPRNTKCDHQDWNQYSK